MNQFLIYTFFNRYLYLAISLFELIITLFTLLDHTDESYDDIRLDFDI